MARVSHSDGKCPDRFFLMLARALKAGQRLNQKTSEAEKPRWFSFSAFLVLYLRKAYTHIRYCMQRHSEFFGGRDRK